MHTQTQMVRDQKIYEETEVKSTIRAHIPLLKKQSSEQSQDIEGEGDEVHTSHLNSTLGGSKTGTFRRRFSLPEDQQGTMLIKDEVLIEPNESVSLSPERQIKPIQSSIQSVPGSTQQLEARFTETLKESDRKLSEDLVVTSSHGSNISGSDSEPSEDNIDE